MLGVKLHVGEAISNTIGGLLGKSSAASSILGKLTGGNGLESWLEDGKFTLHVESSGELSNPKISIKNKLTKPAETVIENLLDGSGENEKDSLKKAGKDLLKGLFK
jgi:hypothetical protein